MLEDRLIDYFLAALVSGGIASLVCWVENREALEGGERTNEKGPVLA